MTFFRISTSVSIPLLWTSKHIHPEGNGSKWMKSLLLFVLETKGLWGLNKLKVAFQWRPIGNLSGWGFLCSRWNVHTLFFLFIKIVISDFIFLLFLNLLKAKTTKTGGGGEANQKQQQQHHQQKTTEAHCCLELAKSWLYWDRATIEWVSCFLCSLLGF